MTNFKSIAGGAIWMLLSVLMVSAALEPVSTQVVLAKAPSSATEARAAA